jgi:autotransporter passenger strand-loop-strand repeat protein
VSGTTIVGGTEKIESGGTASGTTISSGGQQVVFSGGIASDTIINSGGLEIVSSGGLAQDAIFGGTSAALDLTNPSLDRKAALALLLRDTEAGILFNEHIAENGPTVFAHACRLGAEGIVSKKVDSTYQSGPCRVWIKVRNPASIAVLRERSEIWNRRGRE